MSGKLKSLIGIFVIVAGFYYAWNIIPPYFRNYQLQDDLDDIARRNSYTNKSEDEVKQLVITKAKSEGIMVKEDQVTVSRTSDGLGISIRYRVHVDMVVHPVDLDFTANSMNKRI
jgi:hypothetical protein